MNLQSQPLFRTFNHISFNSTISSSSELENTESIQFGMFSMEDLLYEKGLASPGNHPTRKSHKSIETNFTDHGEESQQDISSFETEEMFLQMFNGEKCEHFHEHGYCFEGEQCLKAHNEGQSQELGKNELKKLTRLQNFPQIFALRDKRTRSFLMN